MSRFSLCWLVLLLLLADSDSATRRRKRLVTFRKGSNMFYRLNYKISSLAYTTIFAQASGFKVAWSLPGERSGRELRESAELVYDSHGLDGKACLLKSLCQAMEYARLRDGVLVRILGLLAGSQSNGSAALDPLLCGDYAAHCPLHLVGWGAFAEDG